MKSEWDDPRDIYIPATTGRTQSFDVQEAGIQSAPASMPSVGGGSTMVHFNRQTGELILNCYQNGVDFRLASKAATYYRGQDGPNAVKTVVFLISQDTMREDGPMLHSLGYERIGDANARGQYRWQKQWRRPPAGDEKRPAEDTPTSGIGGPSTTSRRLPGAKRKSPLGLEKQILG